MLLFQSYLKKWAVLSLIPVLLLQVSCNNEVDINADWQETIVIYGILEPGKDVQKIRVSKAFQNEGTSAIAAAKVSDSLFLDTIIVRLKNVNTGIVYTLTPKFNEPKEPGIFAQDRNPIYILDKNIHGHVIQPDVTYEIEAINPITGKRAWASTKVMENATLAAPIQADRAVFNIGENFVFSLKVGRNAYSYDGKMDITIKEWSIVTNDTATKVVRWNYLTDFIVGNDAVALTRIPRSSFLQLLSSVYQYDPNMRRRIVKLDFVTYGGNQQLFDFISVNEPAIGIVQKQAEYSNIVGGYGLFASRTEQWFYDCVANTALIGIIRTDKETKDLNFVF
jgi:hypothetical protein